MYMCRVAHYSFLFFFAAISAQCTEGDVRLRDGTDMEGRVEICTEGVWGTVCDSNLGFEFAQVVCKQLEFSDIGASN